MLSRSFIIAFFAGILAGLAQFAGPLVKNTVIGFGVILLWVFWLIRVLTHQPADSLPIPARESNNPKDDWISLSAGGFICGFVISVFVGRLPLS